MINSSIPDQLDREAALNPYDSFIIQAPAGSGKTELLIQRFLALLGQAVSQPEEIIAITFTKKAASEMSRRIMLALENAAAQPEPSADHKRKTWQLAKQVLKQNEQLGWHLLESPNRLRIQTIDALCAGIAAQMPLLSRLGGSSTIAENPERYYESAAKELLADLESDEMYVKDIIVFLKHINNNFKRATRLLVEMLACREQWLPHIARYLGSADKVELKDLLEKSLKNAVVATLNKLKNTAHNLLSELTVLVRFAASQLTHEHPLFLYRDKCELTFTMSDHELWKVIADLLLTEAGEPRKRVTKNEGFPPASAFDNAQEKQLMTSMKQQMLTFLNGLINEPAFVNALQEIRNCPPPYYTHQQWQVIKSATALLPQLVAKLWFIFSKNNCVDFNEVSLAALHALGNDDEPTDIALRFDNKIRHILVDEFQDTSNTQYRLLEKLTTAWQTGDNRTLFLVGDPMQSIYRFRQAEVRIFMETQQNGLGDLKLRPLRLAANFRSTPSVVNWINNTFPTVFPTKEDPSCGAIAYHPSIAAKENIQNSEVMFHPLFDDVENPKQLEADKIVALIKSHHLQAPNDSIAILVRTKNHLEFIIPALWEAGIHYQAIDIDPLLHRPVVQHLLSLTKAILHLADRIAWLAVLRAPWCGLTLNDLHTVASQEQDLTLWERLKNPDVFNQLTADGKLRLGKIIPIFEAAIIHRRSYSLRQSVERTWQALQGPACLTHLNAFADSNAYFDLLEKQEYARDLLDIDDFEKKLASLFATPDHHTDGKLQIMTMHKAKGLEFDTVILPGLGSRSRFDTPKLLEFEEYPSLLLAPIKALDEEEEPINNYLKKLHQKKSHLEKMRLLYVATTRAKKNLHLLATIAIKNDTIESPNTNTLAHLLWPHFKEKIDIQWQSQPKNVSILQTDTKKSYPSLSRLASSCFTTVSDLLPHEKSDPFINTSIHSSAEKLRQTLEEANLAQAIGILIHRLLKQLVDSRLPWQSLATDLKKRSASFPAALSMLGISSTQMPQALQQVERALQHLLADERGQWILNPHHQESQAEWDITLSQEGNFQRFIIDRTFIDAEGTRWIIDYKTATPQEESLEHFLNREQAQHAQQLENYAKALTLYEQRPIRLGLYFPLIPAWREWI